MGIYLKDGDPIPETGDAIRIEYYSGERTSYMLELNEESTIYNLGKAEDYFTYCHDYIVTKHLQLKDACWTRLTDPQTGKSYLHTDYENVYDSPYCLKDVSVGDSLWKCLSSGKVMF